MTTIIGGGGRSSLALAAMLAMTASAGVVGSELPITRRSGDDDRRYAVWPPRREPDNRGRRAEKDAIALAKAEAKRQRKAAKRAAKVGDGETATEWHYVQLEGRDASMAERPSRSDGSA